MNEPDFPGCEKRFLLNRLLDDEKRREYIEYLEMRGLEWEEIPFKEDEYRRCIGQREKLLYLTNVNAARNCCIKHSFEEDFDFVLPFDSGSCFRQDGWDTFVTCAELNYNNAYFVLGQWRPLSYDDFSENQPCLKEQYLINGKRIVGQREFTVVFGRNYDILFNENLVYGEADKVELLWRLNVRGIWDQWYTELQNQTTQISKHAGTVKMAGWVARLPSGNPEADQNNVIRGEQRFKALHNLMVKANSRCMKNNT